MLNESREKKYRTSRVKKSSSNSSIFCSVCINKFHFFATIYLNNASGPTSNTTNIVLHWNLLQILKWVWWENNECWTAWKPRNRLICTENKKRIEDEAERTMVSEWGRWKGKFSWRHIWHNEAKKEKKKSYISRSIRIENQVELNGWD